MAKKRRLENIQDLKDAPYNPREIDTRSLEGLKTSMGAFGDISGIVWNSRTGSLVAGHQRFRALQEEHGDALDLVDGRLVVPGKVDFPVRTVDWPMAKEKAANVAANSALLAGDWTDGLAGLLDDISSGLPDLVGPLRLDTLGIDEAGPVLPQPLDETVADGISVCVCPECGHQHHKEEKKKP